MIFFVTTAFLFFALQVQALHPPDEFSKTSNLTFEQCVASLPPSLEIDRNWSKNVNRWYVLSTSALDVARGLDLHWTQTPKDQCLLVAPCVYSTKQQYVEGRLESTFYTCNGAKVNLVIEKDSFSIKHQNGTDAWRGIKRIVDTDNKTYMLSIRCWSDGTYGFIILASQRHLSREVSDALNAKVASFGFDSWQRARPFYSPLCPPDL